MIIENISCESFAGKTDLNLELGEGLNLIVGENESGKTTVVDLVRSVLLQDAIVDARTDKSFKELYYPKVEGSREPSPDGTVVLSTAEGKYRITKEWGKKGTSMASLKFPDGTKERDEAQVKEILGELLAHGKGTYDQVVFSSQRHPFASLRTALNLQGADNDLLSSLSQAVLETGGMNLNEFQEKIDQKIDSLQKRWDVTQDLPERKSGGGRYKIKEGDPSITSAYYALQDARDEMIRAGELEKSYEQKSSDIEQLRDKSEQAQEKVAAFDQSRAVLDKRKSLQEQKENAENAQNNAQKAYDFAVSQEKSAQGKADDAQKALKDWPKAQEVADKFSGLFAEREDVEKLEALQKRLENLQALYMDMTQKAAVCKKDTPSTHEVQLANQLQKKIESDKSQLSGINLSALLELANDASISVTKISDGSEIPVENGLFDITESVSIVVPGVMSLQLAPKDVNVRALSEEIAKSTEKLEVLFAKYDVKNTDELDKQQRFAENAQSDYQNAKNMYEFKLGEDSLEDLKAKAANLQAKARTLSEIEDELHSISNGKDPQEEYKKSSMLLAALEVKYDSVDALKEKLEGYKQDVQDAKKKTAEALNDLNEKQIGTQRAEKALAQAPEADSQYDGIKDLDTYRKDLVAAKKVIDDELGDAREELGKLSSQLESSSEEDAQAQVEECEKELGRRKEELHRWHHIREVLDEVLEDAGGNPMKEIEKAFRGYLSEMTDGHLYSGEMAENLGVEVKSGTHPLKWDITSDGTKDVLELALRLAILDQMFPNGGGMVVLDDPFTDMDPKRTTKACAMVEQFAKRNQVIFLTCDPKYKEQFGSAKKVIEWS